MTTYTRDDNGQVTVTEDGRGNDWTKTYDAMGRNVTLVTPNPGGGAYTWTKTYDGNSNITKTNDFKSTDHFYQYDGLNRMTGQGADSGADDESYAWAWVIFRLTQGLGGLGSASRSLIVRGSANRSETSSAPLARCISPTGMAGTL